MKRLTPRERWLLAALPALLLICVYVAFVRGTLTERIATAQTDFDGFSRAPAAPKGASITSARELDALRERVAELAADRRKLEERLAARRAQWTRPATRAHAVRALSGIFAEHELRVRASEPEAPGLGTEALVPHDVDAMARAMARYGEPAPETWRFELEGSFDALVAALDDIGAIGSLDVFALPVCLHAREQDGSGALAVTLWTWI